MASKVPPGLEEEVFVGPVTQRELIITWRKRRQERLAKEQAEKLNKEECTPSSEEPNAKKPHCEFEEKHSKPTQDDQLSDNYSNSNETSEGGSMNESSKPEDTSICSALDNYVEATLVEMGCSGNSVSQIYPDARNETRKLSSTENVSVNGHLDDIQNEISVTGSINETSKPGDNSACSASDNYVVAMDDHLQLDNPHSSRKEGNFVDKPFNEDTMSANLGKKLNIEMPAHRSQGNDEVCYSFGETSVSEDDPFVTDMNCDGSVPKGVTLHKEIPINANTSQIQKDSILDSSIIHNDSKLASEYSSGTLDRSLANELSDVYEDAMDEHDQPNNVSIQAPTKKADCSSIHVSINKSVDFDGDDLRQIAEQVHGPGVRLSGVQNGGDETSTKVKLQSREIVVEEYHQSNEKSIQSPIKDPYYSTGGVLMNKKSDEFDRGYLEQAAEQVHVTGVDLSDAQNGRDETSTKIKSESCVMLLEEYHQLNEKSIQSPIKDPYYSTSGVLINKKSDEFDRGNLEQAAEQVHVTGVDLSVAQNGRDETSTKIKSESCVMLVEEYCQPNDASTQPPTKKAYPFHGVSVSMNSVKIEKCDTKHVEEQVHLSEVHASVVQHGEDTLTHVKSGSYQILEKELRQPNDLSIQFQMEKADCSCSDVSINKKIVEFDGDEAEQVAKQIHIPGVHLSGDRSREDESSTLATSENTEEEHHQPNDLSIQFPMEKADCSYSDVSINMKFAEFDGGETEQVDKQIRVSEVHLSGVASREDGSSTLAKSGNMEEEHLLQPIDVCIQFPIKEADHSISDALTNTKSDEFEGYDLKHQAHMTEDRLSGVQDGGDGTSTQIKSEKCEMLVEGSYLPDDMSLLSQSYYSISDVSMNKKTLEFDGGEVAEVTEQIDIAEVHSLDIQNTGDASLTLVKSEKMEEELPLRPIDVLVQFPTKKVDLSPSDDSMDRRSLELEGCASKEQCNLTGDSLSGFQSGGDETHVKLKSCEMVVEENCQPNDVSIQSASYYTISDVSMSKKSVEFDGDEVDQVVGQVVHVPGVQSGEDDSSTLVKLESCEMFAEGHVKSNNHFKEHHDSTTDNNGSEENKENGPILTSTIIPEVQPEKTMDTLHVDASEPSKPSVQVQKSNIPKPTILKPATLNVDTSSLNTTWVKRLNMSKIPKPKRPCYVHPLENLEK